MDTTKDMSHEASKPAPEPLSLIQRFVNSPTSTTATRSSAHRRACATGSRRGFPAPTRVSEGDLRRAIDVREGLRALLLANNNGEELDEPAGAPGARCQPRRRGVSFGAGGEPELSTPWAWTAIARLLAMVAAAAVEGSWSASSARGTTACGPSTTARRTASGAGAPWRPAGTWRRRARTASGTSRPRRSWRGRSRGADPASTCGASPPDPASRVTPVTRPGAPESWCRRPCRRQAGGDADLVPGVASRLDGGVGAARAGRSCCPAPPRGERPGPPTGGSSGERSRGGVTAQHRRLGAVGGDQRAVAPEFVGQTIALSPSW